MHLWQHQAKTRPRRKHPTNQSLLPTSSKSSILTPYQNATPKSKLNKSVDELNSRKSV